MVAQMRPAGDLLPLLVEPLAPAPRAMRASGWRIGADGAVRDYADDARGAFVQHLIVRYVVHGVRRSQLALETGYSERQVTALVGGGACWTYGQPVLDALAALGIGAGRGDRQAIANRRADRLLLAYESLLDEAARYLRWVPSAEELVATLRLLRAGRDPVRPPA